MLGTQFLARLKTLFHRGRMEDDLSEELQFHLQNEIEKNIKSGMSPEEARYAARRAFGNIGLVKEDTRAMWGWSSLEALVQDVRYGVRLLRRSPAFTLFTVASLALGIGATTAVFSLFDAIVLRSLPVKEPDRLITMSFTRPGGNPNYNMPYPHFERMRSLNFTLDRMLAVTYLGQVNVTFQGQSQIAIGHYATGDYHETLGVRPDRGRLFTPQDDRAGSTVAVISYGYWQRRFGASPTILGSGILINQVPFTIIGVEPRGFSGVEVGRPPDITVPLRARDRLSEGAPQWEEAFSTWILIMGRLKDGVTLQQAQQELNLIYRRVNGDAARSATEQRLAKECNLIVEPAATGASSALRASYERWLRLLLILLGAVLLLASLNVATLLLSRSAAREREIATRLALGAGRWRIVRQLLTESVVLAGLGGALGLLIAAWGSRTLLRIATSATERLAVDLAPDPRVIAFIIGLSSLTCLVFGLIPALRATSSQRITAAREVGGGRRRRLLDRTLVAAQVALSLALLVCAGLFLRSLQNLWAQDTGYDRSSVLMFSVDAKLAGKRGHDVPNTYQKLLDELRTTPGAQAVSISSVRPVSDGYYFISVVTSVGDRDLPDDQSIRIAYNNVGPGYFSTLGIPLLGGRDFDGRDTRNAPKVVIISEKMARHFSGNPVGQRIVGARGDVREVVGVVKDIRYANVKDAPREVVYLPIFQGDPKSMWYTPTFEIRYAGAAGEMMRSVRQVVARIEPELTMFGAKTLEIQTQESLSRERLLALLTSYFGGFALLLACIGLYGLMTYAVAQRTAELGLRMALGALPRAIRWMVLRDSAATLLAGVVIGLLLSATTVRLLQSLLYGVQPYYAATLVGATLLLTAMAFIAAYLPAARASHVDPMTALRHE